MHPALTVNYYASPLKVGLEVLVSPVPMTLQKPIGSSVKCSEGGFCILQVKIAEFSRTPEDFLNKYDELKSKNTRHLDSLVYLLSKLTEDKEVTHSLGESCKREALYNFLGGARGLQLYHFPLATTSCFQTQNVLACL